MLLLNTLRLVLSDIMYFHDFTELITDLNEIHWLIFYKIYHFIWFNKLSNNVQEYLPSGTDAGKEITSPKGNKKFYVSSQTNTSTNRNFLKSFQNLFSRTKCQIMCRTLHWAKVLLLSKWSDSSVMWYPYIADGKGERFILIAGRMQYLTGLVSKRDCW